MIFTLGMTYHGDGRLNRAQTVNLSLLQDTQITFSGASSRKRKNRTKTVARLAGALLITLPTCLLVAHADTPAPFGIVPHKDNTLHTDPGIALDGSPFFPSRASTAGRKTKSDQFDPPEVCGGCHNDIYAQWKGSMMGNAWADPIYRVVLSAVSKATGGKVDNFCMGCHTPVGVVTREAKPSGEGMSEIAARGVQCDVCHNISDSEGIGNGAYVLTPKLYGRPLKFGPFKDAISPYHDTAFSPLHAQSEFCGQCHNVTHPFNRLPIERTYDEWRDSPYSGMNVQCQDCHMKAAPGRATPFSRERQQIHAHNIVGGNMLVPRMLGSEQHAKLAEQMLQSAATVEIFAPSPLVSGAVNTVRVRVTNVGAGHKLPTGFPEGREMWIDFRVMDEAGRTLYRLGEVKDGYTEEGTKRYKVVLGDKEGKVVDLNPIDADRILFDNRIPAKGYDDTEFSFRVPGNLQGKLQVAADVNYWSFPQGFLDHLMGKDAPKVPIATMARALIRVEAAAPRASTATLLEGPVTAPPRAAAVLPAAAPRTALAQRPATDARATPSSSPPLHAATPAAATRHWSVQLAVFATPAMAEATRARVAQQLAQDAPNLPAAPRVERFRNRSYVLFGDFGDRGAAETLADRLRVVLRQDVVVDRR